MAKGLREREVKEGRDADKCRILCCPHPDASISCLSCLVMRGIHFFLLRLLPTAASSPELRFLLTFLLLALVPEEARLTFSFSHGEAGAALATYRCLQP
jgi:hypothetical protein